MNDLEVRRHLAQLLAGLVTEEQLDPLFADIHGKRLALCLCIDLTGNRIDAPLVAKLISSVGAGSGPIHRQFASALEAYSRSRALRCLNPDTNGDSGYVRVMSIRNFVSFYMRQYGQNSQDPNDIEEAKRRYFIGSAAGQPLGDVTRCWSGQFGIVWVCPDDEFAELYREKGENLANELNDVLGLGYSPSRNPRSAGPPDAQEAGHERPQNAGYDPFTELGAVRYPRNLSLPAAQPTTFDADWRLDEGFYMSIKSSENWGKTCSCTGSRDGRKERVHREIEGGLSDEFRAVYLGRAENLVPDFHSVLVEGFRRLQEVGVQPAGWAGRVDGSRDAEASPGEDG